MLSNTIQLLSCSIFVRNKFNATIHNRDMPDSPAEAYELIGKCRRAAGRSSDNSERIPARWPRRARGYGCI